MLVPSTASRDDSKASRRSLENEAIMLNAERGRIDREIASLAIEEKRLKNELDRKAAELELLKKKRAALERNRAEKTEEIDRARRHLSAL